MKFQSIGKYVLSSMAILCLDTSVADASLVAPMGLESMVDNSAQIFVGEVLSVEEGRGDNGLPFVTYQVDVTQPIYGVEAGVTEFRFLGDLGSFSALAGVPTYRRGDEVLLFLRAKSSRGLTSPAGMTLGSMPIVTDAYEPQLKPHPLLIQETAGLTPRERQILSQGSVSVESFVGLVETIIDGKDLP